jgi:hypothetical protein
MRASAAGRVVENARAEKLGTVDVMRRAGVRRKDIVKVFVRSGCEDRRLRNAQEQWIIA